MAVSVGGKWMAPISGPTTLVKGRCYGAFSKGLPIGTNFVTSGVTKLGNAPLGRPPIGKTAMTAAQRMQRMRRRKLRAQQGTPASPPMCSFCRKADVLLAAGHGGAHICAPCALKNYSKIKAEEATRQRQREAAALLDRDRD
jgi:hypothetical protein